MDEELLRQRQVLDKLAREIARRGMCAPAVFVFASVEPLSVVAGQALAFIEPFVRVLLDVPEYEIFREAIESRENLRWMVDRLEELADGRE